ncbi:MAG: MarR family winged helix-turn-helix transcriptional regulator [Suipraeoptans sp.]
MMDSNDSLFALTNKLSHMCNKEMFKRLKNIGLKPGQAGILFCLIKTGPLTQKQLAKRMFITAPSVTVTIQKLEDEDLVIKEVDKIDRRKIIVSITEKGKTLIKRGMGSSGEIDKLICTDMSEEERIQFKELLQKAFDTMSANGGNKKV